MMDWILRKMEKWSITNEKAAERSKARRLQLEGAKNELIANEEAIARADKILLDEKIRRLDAKLEATGKSLGDKPPASDV